MELGVGCCRVKLPDRREVFFVTSEAEPFLTQNLNMMKWCCLSRQELSTSGASGVMLYDKTDVKPFTGHFYQPANHPYQQYSHVIDSL